MLGVSARKVQEMCLAGTVRASKIGATWTIDPADIEDLLRRGANTPPAQRAPIRLSLNIGGQGSARKSDLPPIEEPGAMRGLARVLAWPAGPAGAERRRGQPARATPLPAPAAGSPARCAA
jgi:hypothetical protein